MGFSASLGIYEFINVQDDGGREREKSMRFLGGEKYTGGALWHLETCCLQYLGHNKNNYKLIKRRKE
jgi:hypothetical protein